jgi:peptidoglycan/xylan/chitin deacetylase (PgdA/CDA1 family)
MAIRDRIIGAGFAALGATGLHRLAAGVTRGRGAILMFHHVRPWRPSSPAFAPNRLLEITPEFLDCVIVIVRRLGFEIVSMDEAVRRLAAPDEKPFAVLTFDDGYRDMPDHALPVLERHGAPFTCYIATGFADRGARMWWLELEEAVRRADAVECDGRLLPTGAPQQKTQAFATLYKRLRAGPEARLLETIGALAAQWGVDGAKLVDTLCMDWAEIKALSRHPLATIGAHSISHKMLAKWPADVAHAEMLGSKREIEAHIGMPARHFAYPVGDPASAGPREFAFAREIGFASAITTRPGMIFSEHRDHAAALPRLSINGNWQDERTVEILLSGAPFALWNRGRRVNAD